MTTYYVNPAAANDAGAGTSWGAAKKTLNGAEDIPVVAGDTVYVGPGAYRELLTCDVSGSSGSPISYIADITGEHTDGVGGIVRITGSDNDQTNTRANCISVNTRSWRVFRGFSFDSTTGDGISATSGSNNIIEDCSFQGHVGDNIEVSTGTNWTLRRNFHVLNQAKTGLNFSNAAGTGHTVEDVVIIGGDSCNIVLVSGGSGITFRHCTFLGGGTAGIRQQAAASGGITVNNCLFHGINGVFWGAVAGDIVEDYNTLSGCGASPRLNTSTGANSVTYPALFNPLMLLSGLMLPQYQPFSLSKWSANRAIADTGAATLDLFGMTRPATGGKRSRGAIQRSLSTYDTTTTDGGSGASRKLADAGEYFIRRVQVTNASTTIALKVHREANYAGTNPAMILRQPGQSDRTQTDAGSSGAFNVLTDTFTPAALPPYVDVYVRSSNTATSGSYAVYVDTLTVT